MKLNQLFAALCALSISSLLATAALAQDHLNVVVGQITNWEQQPPIFAQDAGIFKKYNLDVNIVGSQGAGETIQAVISSADVGTGVGVSGAMRAFSRGAPVRILLPAF